MSKAVAVKTDDLHSKAMAIQADAQEKALALAEVGVGKEDLVIPSVQVMQSTSALVSDEKRKVGDIVNMQTEELLGSYDKPVQILPLKAFKTLRIYDVSDGFKFLREEPLGPSNEKLPPEGEEGGVEIKRYHTLNFFVLLKSDLERGEGFPCLIRFKSTGMNAGRALATHLYKRIMFKEKPYSQFVELVTRKEKKDTNTFAVPVITSKPSLKASADEMAAAEGWLAMLAAGNYKVAEEREDPETEAVRSAKPVVVDAEVVGDPNGQY